MKEFVYSEFSDPYNEWWNFSKNISVNKKELMEQLVKFAREFVNEHPEHGQKVADLLQLCRNEIEAGESEINEIQLCRDAIKQLNDGQS